MFRAYSDVELPIRSNQLLVTERRSRFTLGTLPAAMNGIAGSLQ